MLSSLWLFLTAFFPTLCASMGIAVAEVLTNRLLPQQMQYAIQGLSLAAAAVCYMLYLRGVSADRRRRGVMLHCLKALLCIAAWGMVLHRLLLVTGYYDMKILGAGIPLLIPVGLAVLVIGILTEIALVHWSIFVWFSEDRVGFWRSTGNMLRHPLSFLVILAGGAMAAAVWAATDLAMMWAGLNAILSVFAVLLLRMLLIWLIAGGVLRYLTGRMRRQQAPAAVRRVYEAEEESYTEGGDYTEVGDYAEDRDDTEVGSYAGSGTDAAAAVRPPVKRPAASLAAAFLLFLLAGAVTIGGTMIQNGADRITGEIDRELQEAETAFLSGQTADAVKRYCTAGQMIQSVRAYVRTAEEGYSYDASLSAPLTEYMRLLTGGSPEALEQGVRLGELGLEWYPALLSWYEGAEELTPEQQLLRKEMMLRCIAAGFHQVYPNRKWLESHELALSSRISEYEDTETEIRLTAALYDAAAAGGANPEIIDRALSEAEAHPDHLLTQFVAFSLGADYQVDGASHYQRTVEAAKRYDSLFAASDPDKTRLADEKAAVADAMRACYAYVDAIPYYEEAYELTGSAEDALALAECCERAERYDLCAKYAAEAAEADPENSRALYLESLCYIKTGDVDKALEAAGVYADLLQKSESPDYAMEQLFYVIAQYLSMTDSARWTDYVYHYYDELTEEQVRAAQKHDFLWWYMTAINSCFMKKDYDTAEQMLDNILSVHEELPLAWYLKGVVYGSRNEFEKAEQALRKADEIQSNIPAVLYTLANVYDAMKEYDKAKEYSLKVNAILPEQDHGSDIYGIAIHNGNLLRDLEKEVGK